MIFYSCTQFCAQISSMNEYTSVHWYVEWYAQLYDILTCKDSSCIAVLLLCRGLMGVHVYMYILLQKTWISFSEHQTTNPIFRKMPPRVCMWYGVWNKTRWFATHRTISAQFSLVGCRFNKLVVTSPVTRFTSQLTLIGGSAGDSFLKPLYLSANRVLKHVDSIVNRRRRRTWRWTYDAKVIEQQLEGLFFLWIKIECVA